MYFPNRFIIIDYLIIKNYNLNNNNKEKYIWKLKFVFREKKRVRLKCQIRYLLSY